MASYVKTLLRIATLGAAGAASVYVAIKAADELETRSGATIDAALMAEGFDWVSLRPDGLLVHLSGEAPDETARFHALRVAGQFINPANLRDDMEIAETVTDRLPEFRLELLRQGGDLTLHGILPDPSPDAPTLADRLSEALPGLALSDLVTRSPEAAPDGWSQAVDLGVQALAALELSRVLVTPDYLSVSGLAADRWAATVLEDQLRTAKPEGLELSLQLRVPRPVVAPFIARFRIDETGAAFEACSASSSAQAEMLHAAALRAGALDPAPCVEAIGAPDADWERVVAKSMQALADVGQGTLTVSDLTVTLTPGDEVTPEVLSEAKIALEADLPEAYRLDVIGLEAVSADPGDAEIEFTATQSPEGLALLRGPVPDLLDRSVVESFAASQFTPDRRHLSLRQQPGLPEGWTLRILAGIEAFARLEKGTLRVTPGMIDLTGTSGDPDLTTSIASLLTASLGPSTAFNLDISYEEALDPIALLPTAEECLQQIAEIQSDTKITFPPGKTELDADGRRIIRRIAEVLRECPDVAFEIGGHTDSQGRAEMNQALSQARADAVFNALLDERVLASSLRSTGFGETDPIADNDTEDGRESNRRIEFSLQFPLQGPDAPSEPDVEQSETDTENGQN